MAAFSKTMRYSKFSEIAATSIFSVFIGICVINFNPLVVFAGIISLMVIFQIFKNQRLASIFVLPTFLYIFI